MISRRLSLLHKCPSNANCKGFQHAKNNNNCNRKEFFVANSIYAMIKSRYIIREMTYENANFFESSFDDANDYRTINWIISVVEKVDFCTSLVQLLFRENHKGTIMTKYCDLGVVEVECLLFVCSHMYINISACPPVIS